MIFEDRYKKAIDKVYLKKEAENRMLKKCFEYTSQNNRDIKASLKIHHAVKIGAVLVIIAVMFGIIPIIKNTDNISPLVISVYAEAENGISNLTDIKMNQQVRVSPESVIFGGTVHAGYSFNLSLCIGKYISLAVVDKNGNVMPTNEETIGQRGEKGCWALTEGDDIAIITSNEDGSVPDGYKKGTIDAELHSSSFIWIPNDEDNSWTRIICYDENYNKTATYILKMSKKSIGYYAEILLAD